jgi:hypothetical protein
MRSAIIAYSAPFNAGQIYCRKNRSRVNDKSCLKVDETIVGGSKSATWAQNFSETAFH